MDEKFSFNSISVVITVYNEEGNIPELCEKLKRVLSSLNFNSEIIFVDDGSNDDTFRILKEINKKDNTIKIIKLRKNFGKSAALKAAFDYAKGDVIVTMDGDLQDDPEDIPLLLAKINEGYDMVNGWRADRKDPFVSKKLPSRFFNWLASRITGVNVHDFGGPVKAFTSEVAKNFDLYAEMHRYLPALAKWMGASITEIKVKHYPRKQGKSKYGITRLIRGFFDLLTVKFLMSYSSRPLQMFGLPGILSLAAGFIISIYLIFEKFLTGASIGERPLLLLAVLLIIVGIQFLMMGLLGDMTARIYYESQDKKLYSIREIVG